MKRPSNIYFKVVDGEGSSLEEVGFTFSLPKGPLNGAWHEFSPEAPCLLYKNPLPFYEQGMRIYVAGFDPGDITTIWKGIVWVRRLRLIREATSLDLRPFGIHRAIAQNI